IVDAELVEHERDLALVFHREIHARGLGAVAQGGVEDIKPLFLNCGHGRAPGSRSVDRRARAFTPSSTAASMARASARVSSTTDWTARRRARLSSRAASRQAALRLPKGAPGLRFSPSAT